MKIKNVLCVTGLSALFFITAICQTPDLQIPIDQWLIETNALPYYRNKEKWLSLYMHKVEKLTATEFKNVIDAFIESEKHLLQNTNAWLDKKTPEDAFFTQEEMKKHAQAVFYKDEHEKLYAQKLIVPAGSQIAFQGDLHGDMKGLLAFLSYLIEHKHLDAQTLKIKKKNFYIGFLGDYTDRGMYGAEVIYTILRLKMQNPRQVFMVRGNHEHNDINQAYGFHTELITKFGLDESDEIIEKLNTMYRILPVVLYLGTAEQGKVNYVQCNHGGIEWGYIPTQLLNASPSISFEWIEKLSRQANLNLARDAYTRAVEEIEKLNKGAIKQHRLHYTQPDPNALGFLWSDYLTEPKGISDQIADYNSGRGWAYGEEITKAYLDTISSPNNNVRAIFRAHQHSADWTPLMKIFLNKEGNLPELQGIAKLWYDQALHKGKTMWDGMVATFLVAPDTAYGQQRGAYTGFYYNAIGILTTKPKFADWHLQTIFITHDEIKQREKIKDELKHLNEWVYKETSIEQQLTSNFLQSTLSAFEQKISSLNTWLSKRVH